ncbi:MAG TPA: RagB/SusD family nutrient uptake outer membrane protein [Sphingobacterium sp.]|nr:RagB/SusD family nutrient uptake outer membrane protein [Sphingobacterium sp.]
MSLIRSFFALLIILYLVSCHKILDVEPYTFSSDVNYYENESQILRAVNGAYGSLQELYTGEGFWAMTEMVSDNTNYQFDESDRGAQQREEIDEFLITSTNNYVESVWNLLYRNIQQTNVVIERMEPVEFVDQKIKDRYSGEVRFLRAFQYFHLVRLFGSVPLITEEIKDPESSFKGDKASIDELYEFILSDLDYAVDHLPEKYTGNDIGRVTKGAVLTLLGEVYLTLREYDKAKENFEKVTELNYALLSDYAQNFDPAYKNNIESIFSIQFDESLETEASNFIFMFGPRNAKDKLIGFPGNLGGSNIPTLSMFNAYESNDKRREASIEFFDDPTNEKFEEAKAFEGKIPFIKKYYHPPFLEDGRSNENWPVYRYSHVLLMLAEAMNELGQGDPYPYLNKVRERAGLDAIENLNQDELREAIFQEQRTEVAFENHRWFQLLRTDKAIEIMTEHGIEEKDRLKRLSSASYNIQEYKLLFPIPEREVRLNKLEQNPEW